MKKITLIGFLLVFCIVGCGSKTEDIPPLDKSEALALIINANKSYSYLVNGGENPPPEIVGKELLVIDKEIDTREKVINLLNKTYTTEFSKLLYDQLGYTERNDRIYKPIYDLPETVIWDRAEIDEVNVVGDKAMVKVQVPCSVGSGPEEIITKQAFFRYENDKGWRLDGRIVDIEG